jgi:hypothetical protein
MSKEIKITRESISKVINDLRINNFEYKTTYVEIEGRKIFCERTSFFSYRTSNK